MPKATFFNLPEDKRQLIVDLAIEEFADQDYRNASISNIVSRAGIAKGSLYQYFENKRDLYLYLIQLAGTEKKQFLAQHPPPDPSMDVFDFMHWLMREGARFELSNPRLAQVAYRALFSDRPFGDEPFSTLRQSALDYYGSLVRMGVEQGGIDPEIDRGLAVFLFSSIFNDFGRYLLEREQVDLEALARGEVQYQALPVEALADQLIEILRRGLAPRRE
jgi:TetR/AcrR family transcriptional regulator